MRRVNHTIGFLKIYGSIGLGLIVLATLVMLGGRVGIPAAQSRELDPARQRLTIGGAFVNALADFQRFGGEVDEATTSELAVAGPQTFGQMHGRSMFAIESDEAGRITGFVTADGGTVTASVAPDGSLALQPASAGFLTRNAEIFQALYPTMDPPAYTEEVIFEYVDESGARLLMGGAEVDNTTRYLVKKDPATGEIVFRLQRDLVHEKAPGNFLDPDVSATFPTRVKFCDARREHCVTRNIIKKPGDEIRLDPRTRQINVTFNKENLPFWKKYGNAERLHWACEHQGRGFYITYREGSLGGFEQPGQNDMGTLSCQGATLKCARNEPGQKCHFDWRDYLDRPAELALFGLDWLLARQDPHTHYFTLAPDPLVRRHIRIGNMHNLDAIRDVGSPAAGRMGDGHADAWVTSHLQQALCEGVAWPCVGQPTFKVLEVTSVNDGLVLIDERTATKLTNVERAHLYSLRKPYGWGKRGDFVAVVITNAEEAAEVMALKRLNAELEAPNVLEWDSEEDLAGDVQVDAVEAMQKGLEEEKTWEIKRVRLAERTQALVIFPTVRIDEARDETEEFTRRSATSTTAPATILPLVPTS